LKLDNVEWNVLINALLPDAFVVPGILVSFKGDSWSFLILRDVFGEKC